MNNDCEKTTAHSQNILHGDTLYNIKRKKYKTVCAELIIIKIIMVGPILYGRQWLEAGQGLFPVGSGCLKVSEAHALKRILVHTHMYM